MKLFLAGISTTAYSPDNLPVAHPPYVLESYHGIKPWFMEYVNSADCKGFLLDSGAFTFFKSNTTGMDWNQYIEGYIKFINDNKIEHFFELDIDSVIGLPRVEDLRRVLENGTGKQCIPVWHKSRGKEYFLRLIDEYEYVSIGGIASREISRSQLPVLQWFIDQANKKDVKVHLLGYTPRRNILRNFYSCDSSSWTAGVRGGFLDTFQNGRMIQTESGNRLKNGSYYAKEIRKYLLLEWVKYQHYLDTL